MPKGYQHLTQDKRCQIYAFKKSGKNQMEISKEVSVSQSIVCRELQRNSGKKGYRHKQAHEKSLKRRLDGSLLIKKMTGNVLVLAEKCW
jgi:IS30 family transposase